MADVNLCFPWANILFRVSSLLCISTTPHQQHPTSHDPMTSPEQLPHHNPNECRSCSSARAAFSSLKYTISTSEPQLSLFQTPVFLEQYQAIFNFVMKQVHSHPACLQRQELAEMIDSIIAKTKETALQIVEASARLEQSENNSFGSSTFSSRS